MSSLMSAKRWLGLLLGIALFGVGWSGGYYRATGSWLGLFSPAGNRANSDKQQSAEKHHDHKYVAHEGEGTNFPLSEQARNNLKLKFEEVKLGDYWRTISIPGEVEEKPGHSESRITSTVNGIIRKVYVLPGQTVKPGDPLFDVQTTGEVLANAQSALLKTLQERDLVDAELKRLKPIAEQGAVPGIRLLEKQYERQRLESMRQVQTQELLVRGLSMEQIERIIATKILLREFTVHVPGETTPHKDPTKSTSRSKGAGKVVQTAHESGPDVMYSVERIPVYPGKQTQPGDDLCDLAVHTNLRITGMAFQNESELVSRVMEEQRSIRGIFDSSETQSVVRDGLRIEYVDNVVDPQSRLFRFYLPIENEVVRDLTGTGGVKFRVWRFKPGQRVRLLVPVEHWTQQIVLPTEAVVKEGADAYVFRANGKLLERVTVTVKYEDPRTSVIAAEGDLFPGDVVAVNEAYQLNLALRKLQGSGADPHAGHDHAH